jgi:hypothetical protein
VHICPLSVYIDLVCDGRLEALIISGKPSEMQLAAAAEKLTVEFSELSSDNEMESMTAAAKTFYLNRSYLLCFDICYRLVNTGKYEKAVEYLNTHGLPCKVPQNDTEKAALLKATGKKIKSRMVKYKEAEKQYKIFAGKSEKPTRKYFTRILVMLSSCEVIKMRLNPK